MADSGAHSHAERHFRAPERVRDVVLGMADGLTVPFALAAGLTGAVASSRIVVTAGLAEIVAGSIAMGLGGYLAARSEIEHYASELKREWREVREKPLVEERETEEIFEAYGLSREESRPLVLALQRSPENWVDFMMRFELGLEKPNPKRALASALTIATSYIVGGLLPLSPYFFAERTQDALVPSAVVTVVALAVFGYLKGHFTGMPRLKSSAQTVSVGALAAFVAFSLARWLA